MPDEQKTEMKKLKNQEVDSLKGKLVEVRRVGAHPFFISVTKNDTVKKGLEKADIPLDDDEYEVKVEAIKARTKTWKAVKLSDKIYQFDKIAVTTKVRGSY